MDPVSIVEDTEQTRLSPQTDGRIDGQCGSSLPRFNFVERGIKRGRYTENS